MRDIKRRPLSEAVVMVVGFVRVSMIEPTFAVLITLSASSLVVSVHLTVFLRQTQIHGMESFLYVSVKENGRKRKIIEVYNWNFLSHFILNPIKLYDISFSFY